MRLILLIVWKEFQHIFADPLTARLILVPAVVELFLIGYAFTTEVKNVPIVIVDECRSEQSRSLIESVKRCPAFHYTGTHSSRTRALKMIEYGKTKMVLVLPESFSDNHFPGQNAPLQLITDGQDANSCRIATGYLNSIIGHWSLEQIRHSPGIQTKHLQRTIKRSKVEVMPVVLFNPDFKSSWYMIPSLVIILVTMTTGLLTGFSIVKEKEAGTLEQLLVTPIKPIHIIIGKIIPFAIIGVVEIAVLQLLAALWFDIPFKGSPMLLIGFSIIYLFSSLGIGILTSTITNSAQQVLFLIWFIFTFYILLSGWFIPIENMPPWIQAFTIINPVRFFITVVREITLKGTEMRYLIKDALALVFLGIFFCGLSVLLFTRKPA